MKPSGFLYSGRIVPVERQAHFSGREMSGAKYKPPAMRVSDKSYTKNHLSVYNRGVQATIAERKGDSMANKSNDLAHRKWMCKYHIVFTPKYRRKVIYNQYLKDLRDILKQLCRYKGVEIIEGHLMPDHVHMLVSIPPKMSVSSPAS